MNQLVRLGVAAALSSQIALPAYADEFEGFSVQHTVKGEEMPEAIVSGDDPLILLNKLKNDITAQLEAHGKPLSIETIIMPVIGEEIEEEPPVLGITTTIDKDGQGKSELGIDEWKATVPADDETSEVSIEWGGLVGSLTYNETFAEPSIDMVIYALNAGEEDEDGFGVLMGETTLKGTFDDLMLPTMLDFQLPSLEVGDSESGFTTSAISLKSLTRKTESGLDLTKADISIGSLNFGDTEEEFDMTLSGFKMAGDGDISDDTVSYTLTSALQKLVLKGIYEDDITVSYTDDWSLNHVDVASMIEIQNQVRELHKQRSEGTLSEDMMSMAMMGTLMQVIPGLLSKSPEIAINKMQLETDEGELQGKASVSIDGSKPLNIQDMAAMLAATTASANFTIDKALLESVMLMQMQSEMDMPEADLKEMVTQQITGLEQQNLIKADGSTYKLDASLEGGKFMLNGQEMPLPM